MGTEAQFDKSPSDHTAEWASLNAWIARLVATDLYGPKGLDYYMHRASYNFLYVLDVQGHAKFSTGLPAAANLFRYAGPVLLRMCQEETRCPEPPIGIFSESVVKKEGEGREVLFKGLGYSVERWEWWKKRWEQLAAATDVGEDVRADAREASEAMRGAESSSRR